MHVVRGKLVIPLQFPIIGIQSEDAIGEKVVTWPVAVVRIGEGIARGPKQSIRIGIIGTREPSGPPSEFGFAAFPRLDPWFSLSRDGPNAPHRLSRVSLISSEKTANAPIASRDSRHDQIL